MRVLLICGRVPLSPINWLIDYNNPEWTNIFFLLKTNVAVTVIGSALHLRLVEMAIGKVFADGNCSFFNANSHFPFSDQMPKFLAKS